MKRNNKLAKAGFVIVLMALDVLCVSALAEENTTDYAWAGRGEAQKSMGLVTEASASFYVARKLGYLE